MKNQQVIKKLLKNIEYTVRSEKICNMNQLRLYYEEEEKPYNIEGSYGDVPVYDDEKSFIEKLLENNKEQEKKEKNAESNKKVKKIYEKIIEDAKTELIGKYRNNPEINVDSIRFADEERLIHYIKEIIFIEEHYDNHGLINKWIRKGKIKESQKYTIDIIRGEEYDRMKIIKETVTGNSDQMITQIYTSILGYIPDKEKK